MPLQVVVNGLAMGCLYALLATGFALVYNTTRVFHIAYAVTYTAASYFCYVALSVFGLPLVVAVPLAIVLTAALGASMERFVYEPLRRRDAPLHIFLVSSIGLNVALTNLVAMLFGNQTRILRRGLAPTYAIRDVVLTDVQLAELVVGLTALPLLLSFLRFAPLGRTIRALRDNPQLTELMGIDTRRTRWTVFALGSALAAMASILASLDLGMDPADGMSLLLLAAVAVIVGGLGSFRGAVLGGIVLGLLQAIVLWRLSARWIDGVVFGVLVLFLLFRPRGLAGQARRVEELA